MMEVSLPEQNVNLDIVEFNEPIIIFPHDDRALCGYADYEHRTESS